MISERSPAFWSSFFAFLLGLFTVLAYSNTFHVPFIFDDIPNIKFNELVFRYDAFTLENFKRFWISRFEHGRPVAFFTFALNYCFGGHDTTGYHLVNVAIHVVSGIGVFFFTRLLLAESPVLLERESDGAAGTGTAENVIAGLTALIWTLHPVQTESVTYIVQRMTSLAGMFYFWGLYFYLRRMTAENWFKHAWFLVLVVLFFFLGVGSKEIVATLPLAIWLIHWLLFPDHDLFGDQPWVHLGGILVFIGAAGLYFIGQSELVNLVERLFSSGHVPGRHWSISERLMTEGRIVLRYLLLVFVPLPRMLNLDRNPVVSTGWLSPPTTILSVLTIAILLFVAWRCRKSSPALTFCVFWFGLHLLITSTVVPLELMYDHRLYIPLFGPVFLLVYLFVKYVRVPLLYRVGLGVFVSLSLGVSTHARNSDWSSWVSIYRDVVRKTPNNPRGRKNLASGYVQKAEDLIDRHRLDKAHELLRKAKKHHKQAIRLAEQQNRPMEDYDRMGYVKSTIYLAMVELDRGNVNSAFEQLTSIERSASPETSKIGMTIARSMLKKKNYHEAIKRILMYISKYPDLPGPYQLLVKVYVERDRTRTALDILKRAPDPESREAKARDRLLRGRIFTRLGQEKKSRQFLQSALELAGTGEQSGSNRRLIAEIHAALARYHHSLTGDHAKRAKHARKSLKHDVNVPDRNQLSRWAKRNDGNEKEK